MAPQPGMPGKPSAASPTSASQSGMEAGGTPNLRRSRRPRPGRCPGGGPSRRRAPRPRPARGPCPASTGRPARRRPRHGSGRAAAARASSASNSTIGQTTTPSARTALLGELELGQQVGVDAGARLVAGVQVVAERLDDVVEGAGDVRHPRRREQQPQAAQQADGRADLAAVGVASRRRAEVAAEELVGPVDEVDLSHSPGLRAPPNLRTARACARSASISRSFGAAVVTSSPQERGRRRGPPRRRPGRRLRGSRPRGSAKPLIFLTYWSAAARISSSVAGGSKLYRVLMFRHTWITSSGEQSRRTGAPRRR